MINTNFKNSGSEEENAKGEGLVPESVVDSERLISLLSFCSPMIQTRICDIVQNEKSKDTKDK